MIVKHMGHNGPWLLIKTAKEIRERRAYIRANKPKHEITTRLRLLKVVKQILPPPLAKARAARDKAYAAWEKARAAWDKADAAWEKARAAWEKAYAADKAYAAWDKADAAWEKACAAWEKAYAAWDKAYAAWEKARAADKAYAAWDKAINSKAGVAFHKKVCGCGWAAEQPDVLKAEGVNP